MGTERPHRLERADGTLDLSNVYIEVDHPSWSRPCTLTLETLGSSLQIKVNENYLEQLVKNDVLLKECNVTSVEVVNQNEFPFLPPHTFSVNVRTHIAIDENYLYVWVPQLSKWKRILLSDW